MRTRAGTSATRVGLPRHIVGSAVALVLITCVPATRAEITFQHRNDLGVGSNPSAFTLLPGLTGVVMVANADGLAAYHYEDDVLVPGPRAPVGRGAQVLVAGPLGPNGVLAVAFASREAARVAVAIVDKRGALGTPEQIELPALPRAARIGALSTGELPALFVTHDDGLSVLVRGPAGWRRTDVAVPAFSRDFAVGDLDGDGRADVVLADETAAQLTLLRGAADGTFATIGTIATVRAPRRLVLADVTADGRPDLLVIGDDALALHRTDAAGNLAGARAIYRGDHLADVAVGDIDGAGALDLAVLDRSRATLSVLTGREDGTFTQTDSYLVGYGAESALLADLDGDRRVDVLTLNRLGDSATLLRGRGGGVFDGVVCLPAELGDLTALAIDDFDGDGLPDLAAASEDGGKIGVFLGRGDGRFTAASTLPVGRQPRALAAGDFNQDGFADLAVVNFGADAVAILQGDGHGGFAPPHPIRVGTGPSAISLGSFGSDTATDLAIVNSLSDSVSVLYGDGHGDFPTVNTYPVSARPSFLIVGDTNRDGHQDLVVGSQFSESVAILLGDGHQLTAPTTNKLAGTAKPSQAEDFDRDGQMDLVNADEAAGVVEILPGTDASNFGTAIRIAVARDPHTVAIADFDRDGRIDIAVAHRATQTIAILLNRSVAKRRPAHGDRAASTTSDDES